MAAPEQTASGPRMRLSERLGLGRPELRAWALYDWANSAAFTTVVASLFPIYYREFSCANLPGEQATSRFAFLTAASLVLAALVSPILGAIADFAAAKKKLLALFLTFGSLALVGMFWTDRGDWVLASALYLAANLGLTGSLVFYDSLLPHVAAARELDRVSTAGYALGYLGGGVHLLLVLLAFAAFGALPAEGSAAEASSLPFRLAFFSVALWWAAFSLPLFRRVPEPPRMLESDEIAAIPPLRAAWTRLGETFREIRGYRNAFLMLLAFLLYNDGIGTIIRMAAIYGKELGLSTSSLAAAILLVQFAGIPFSFLFGALAGKIGPKRAIYLCLLVYSGITVLACFLRSEAEFFLLSFLVATVQGGSQAISRSLFASLIPKRKSAEFFGFFAVMDKFGSVLGPLLFGGIVLLTGSQRGAILSVLVFFVAGGWLLSRVDVEAGRKSAQL